MEKRLGKLIISRTLRLRANSAVFPLHYRRLALSVKLLSSCSVLYELPSTKSYPTCCFISRVTNSSIISNLIKPSHTILDSIASPIIIPSTPTVDHAPFPCHSRLDQTTKGFFCPAHLPRALPWDHRTLAWDHPMLRGRFQSNRVGYAFSIDNVLHSHRHRNSASIYTAALQAIYHGIVTILHRPTPMATPDYLIISDSLASLTTISDPYSPIPSYNTGG